MIPLLLGIGVLAAPAVKQARYSRSESYAGQYVQRCSLTGVAVANKQALVNLDVMASKIYTFFSLLFSGGGLLHILPADTFGTRAHVMLERTASQRVYLCACVRCAACLWCFIVVEDGFFLYP